MRTLLVCLALAILPAAAMAAETTPVDIDVLPPHAAKSGLRLLTVISGAMSWGDGGKVDESRETVYPPGGLLTVPAKLDHWLAARSEPVRIQVIVLDDETAVP